jgi:uncharacterized membrane protein
MMNFVKIDLYKSKQDGPMGAFRTLLVRGILFMLPLAITLFVVKYALGFVDDWFGGPTAALIRVIAPHWLLSIFPDGHIPGMSMVLLVALLLTLGGIISYQVGRQGLRVIDIIVQKIPMIGGIYSSSKKIIDTFGESGSFQRAVWFEMNPGVKCIGFVTHEFIEETSGQKHLMLFYPLVPNPSAGMVVCKAESETLPVDMDAKEVFTMMVALGTTMPDRVRMYPEQPPQTPLDAPTDAN